MNLLLLLHVWSICNIHHAVKMWRLTGLCGGGGGGKYVHVQYEGEMGIGNFFIFISDMYCTYWNISYVSKAVHVL